MFIGYFDETKRNITVEDQKSIVDSYINEHKINLDIVLSSSDFGSIFENINTPKHTIIVSNTTCLGNKLERINANFKKLLPLKLELISVKENLHLRSDENLSAMIEGINLAIKIRSSMTSTITRQALNKKREQGYKLGRDFGFKKKRYIWEGKELDYRLPISLFIMGGALYNFQVSHLFLFFAINLSLLYLSTLNWIKKIPVHIDISYGVYIWGWFVQQIVQYYGYAYLNYYSYAVVCIFLASAVAVISYYLVEKPCLKLKNLFEARGLKDVPDNG